MPEFQKALLGFDIREMFLSPQRLWSEQRRREYLLRQDVEKPLSADSLVWPSIFGEGLPPEDIERLRLDGETLPTWRGSNQSLWDDLSVMRDLRARIDQAPELTIAISWIEPKGGARAPDGLVLNSSTSGAVVLPGVATLLGFDVTDVGLLSGLTNCSYPLGVRADLQNSWVPWLNEHHLFDDAQAACDFRDMTNTRIPEHSPFFVCALHRLA